MSPWTEQQFSRYSSTARALPIGSVAVIAAVANLKKDAYSMAKALVGFVGGDPRLLDDNQRLRRRIAELEALVLRLQAENDALAAQLHKDDLLVVPDTIEATAVSSA
jgi:hypothetical protein